MKKRFTYIIIAALLGLFVGYLIFGNKDNKVHQHESKSTSEALWTCSMHPQIMQAEPGDCPICGMDLIPADTSGEGLTLNEIRMTKNAMALAGVETITVGSGMNDTTKSLKLSGKVTINQQSDAVQSAYFNGRLEKLNVNYEGEEVKKGQQLATIYSPELAAAQQELITTSGLKEAQPALYKAVRNKLKLWNLSENQINQIEKTGKVKENFPVFANVSGVVSSLMVEEGDYVKTGMPLLKIANLNTVWVIFDGYESQLSLFEEGQRIEVSSNSYPEEVFKAKISFVDPMLNSNTRTLQVRAELNNKKGLLKPGMFVVGEIKMEGKKEVQVTIPESAVLWTGERSLVYVKTNPNEAIFEMREVALGILTNGYYTVTSGLKNGEEIVSSGTFTVDAAAQLQGKKSMMNKEGGRTTMGHEGHTGIKQKATESTSPLNERTPIKMTFSIAVQQRIKKLLDSYLLLKDALVASNAVEVQKYGQEALAQAVEIEEMEMDKMEKSHLGMILEKLKAISKTKSIDQQRKHFLSLSENMITVVQNLEDSRVALYVQTCPMAAANAGGLWISMEKEIKNPYFGAQMLKCGEVKQVLFQ
ncbi:efflux RND transporter periplasmic adaptor subunit [Ascidiimonas sp. W6]|uniref:efflux RND transporter periplasmic adaptor subunit n=1 Tax=Ascidiimonas meishanensis TaxID=3128903 RepID=UPI0030EBFFC2